MEQACEFSLDVQELAQAGNLNPKTFGELVAKYNPTREDKTLTFPDGSTATWVEEEQAWRLG